MEDKNKFQRRKVPTIGAKQSEVQQSIQQLVEFLEPILGQLSAQIEDLQLDMAVVKRMVNATVVDILAKRVENKLGLKYKLSQQESDSPPEKEKK